MRKICGDRRAGNSIQEMTTQALHGWFRKILR
jgi:hypothetical protein